MCSDVVIMNKGINCLIENLGVLETEQFISVIMREKFDYTKWQQEHFDYISSESFQCSGYRFREAKAFSLSAKYFNSNICKYKKQSVSKGALFFAYQINDFGWGTEEPAGG